MWSSAWDIELEKKQPKKQPKNQNKQKTRINTEVHSELSGLTDKNGLACLCLIPVKCLVVGQPMSYRPGANDSGGHSLTVGQKLKSVLNSVSAFTPQRTTKTSEIWKKKPKSNHINKAPLLNIWEPKIKSIKRFINILWWFQSVNNLTIPSVFQTTLSKNICSLLVR